MAMPRVLGAPAVLLRGVLLVAAAVGGHVADAVAQEQQPNPPEQQPSQGEQPRFTEEVQVTGSLIPRPTLEALSPVAVLEPEAITYTGITRLEDLLTTLPQVFATYANATVTNGATGSATVDLRHLGEVRTLVLVNGRRLPTGDVYSTVADLNFIPAALIKRIDILTGGASSVYGADAVAGVVNFVLDTQFEGLKGGVEYGAYQHDNRNHLAQRINAAKGFTAPRGSVWDGDVTSANVAYGGAFADGKGHATVYLDYRHIDAITKDKRDYTNCSLGARETGPVCSGSSTIPAGRFVVYNQDFTDYRSYTLDLSNNQLVPYAGQTYNYGALNYMQRPDRRWLGGGFVNYRFNPHVEGYAEVMFMDDYTEAQIAPSGDFGNTYLLNCDNPMLSDQQRELFCTQWGYGPHDDANVVVIRRSLETGNRYDALRHTAWRLVAGARGAINKEWSYDVYGLHAEVQVPESYHNDLNADRLQDALLVVGDPSDPSTWRCRSGNAGCVPWNIFSAGGVTQAAADYIRTVATSTGSTETEIIDGKLNGDLTEYGLRLPTALEGVQVAFGALYRRENLVIDPDEVERNGLVASAPGPVPPVRGSYSVKELYVEGRVPVIQARRGARDLSLELGYRYSDYNLSGSHPTYKAQLSYAPVSDVKLRAGLARAVRAPNVVELFTPQVSGVSVTPDPCVNDPETGVPSATLEECERTGLTAALYGHVIPPPGAFEYRARWGGNPGLIPEKADTRTVGLVLTPGAVPGFTLALDYYDIEVKDTIGWLSTDDIMRVCMRTGDPHVCDLIHRDATGSLWLTPDGYIDDTNQNIGALASRGIDVNVTYMLPAGKGGFFDMSLIGSYLIENSISTPAFSYDCAGYFGNQCVLALARWRHRASFSWQTSFNTVFNLGWRMIGPVKNDDASPDPDLADPALIPRWKASGSYRYPAYHFFDLSATYNLTKGIQLTVGVNNVFDKEPPLGAGLIDPDFGPGFYGTYDPWGRFVHASMRFTFE